MNTTNNEEMLFNAILTLKTADECKAFLEDLCTPQELKALAQRLEVANMLKEGCNYKAITDKTHASTATVARVNKTITYQTAGGYELVLKRLKGDE